MKYLLALLLFLPLPALSAKPKAKSEFYEVKVSECAAVSKATVEAFKGLRQSTAISFDGQKIVEYIVRSNPNLMGAPNEYLDAFGEMLTELCIDSKGKTELKRE